MPTYNRRRFVPEAIRLFLAQDYPAKELIVVDDGEDDVADVIPNHPQIRFLRLENRQSQGAKRNLACSVARGEVIAHWDDDDWYAPWRLSRQVDEIVNGHADICGLARMLFLDRATQRAWEYVYPAGALPWVYGATFCYRKSLWERGRFLGTATGSDNLFIANLPGARVRALPRVEMYVGLIHGANASQKRTNDPLWRAQPTERIRLVVRGNWAQMPRRAPRPGAGAKPVAAVSTSFGAAAAVAGALSVTVVPAAANPKGGQVSAGSATITQTSPTQLDIVQSTNRAAIDWQSFSIAPGEQTNFQQPAASSVTLNRVQPGDPSVIGGRLTANGQVVLINPSGITFSKGAVVDVNSLVATPTDISNANFMAGNMKFDKPSTDPRATVVNQGSITVAKKGLAALVAPGVANSGTIQAKLGKVVLAGAQTYAVDFYGDGLISFDVGPKVTTVPTGPDGQPVKSLVSNKGRIDAPGGTVVLTADAAAGIIQNVVDVPGRISARTSGQTPGSVTIDAGPGDAASVSGKIDVSGLKPRQTGGSATVTGGSVNLASTARLDARGNARGGTVRVGGGPHGQDPTVRNAQTTSVAAGAVIDASAVENGNGGQVTVWSDRGTQFTGTIIARGGPNGGDGGWVETSAKSGLSVLPSAQVDAAAPKGRAGNWLLDPGDLTVTICTPFCTPTGNDSTVDAVAVSTALNSGTNVTLTTVGNPGTQNGNIAVNALNMDVESGPPLAVPISWSTAAQLTLNAAGNISIQTPITGSNAGSTLALNAGLASGVSGSISQSAAITIGTLTGSSTAGAFLNFPGVTNLINHLGPFTDSSLFGISLTNAQPLIITGPVNAGSAGSINLTTTGPGSDMTLAAGLTGPTVILTSAGAITQTAGTITAGNLEVEATGQVALGAPNAVRSLSATVSGAANGFLFRNDQHDLTIQSVPGDGTGFAGVTTNGGPIEVVTTGTSTSGFNLTIAKNPPLGTVVSSGGGTITLMAGGKGGTFTNGGTINSTLAASTSPPSSPGAGDITILADMMTLGSGTITAAMAGATASVVLGPVTSTTPTALGTPPLGTPAPAGSLNLMQSDLDSISAGMLQVGYRNTDGTPSLTGNINIAWPITINTSVIPSLLLVTGGGVTESPGAFINSTPGGTLPLGVIAGGSVTMTQTNRAGVLAGLDDGGAANSFVYRNDAVSLNIGALSAPTIGVAFDPVTGIPTPSAITTGPLASPLSGVTTNGSALTVATTGGVNLTVNPSFSVASGGGAVTMMAGGAGAAFTNNGAIDSTAAAATAGTIAIVADNVSLAPGTINAGTTGTVMVGPFTAANGISVGAAGSAGILGLTQADLATVTAGLLQVGYRNVNGTPLVTGNIDIAAPITIDTTKLASLLLVTGGGVTETPGAFINSTAGGPPLAFGVIAGGPVSLGQTNQAAVVAGFVDGASNSFLYRNDSAGLTIGTLPASTIGLTFDAATGIPSSAKMAGPATNPLAGVTTAGGSILLETTTTGNLAIDQPVNAGPGAVGLSSAGTLAQDPAPIIASSLAILSADRVSLGAFGGANDLNHVSTLAGRVLNASESFVFRNDAANLTIGTVDVVDSFGARLVNPASGAALTRPLSGVVTNNANIGLRVTASGNLNLTANVDAGSAAVGLESAGMIRQTAGTVAGSALEVSAVGPVLLLDANTVPVLASQTTGAGGSSSFQYRNDAVGLTVGTVPTLLESGTGNQILSVAGLSGVRTAGGSILLETTTSGNLVLNQAVNVRTGSATLTSAGTITEPVGGSITAATLTGGSVRGTTLNQANLLTNLGPFTNAGAGGFALTDGQTLNVTGPVDAGTGGLALRATSGNLVVGAALTAGTTVTLSSAGTITEPAGGSITAATLTGGSVGGTTLNQANLLTNLGPFTNAGAAGFALTDTQTLNVTGAVDAGTGSLALRTTSGNLVVGAGLTAGTTVTLSSAGTITEAAGGSISAAALTGNSVGGTALNQPNLLASLGPFTNAGAGGFALTDAHTLNVIGAVDASAGSLALTTGGNLVVGAGLSAGATVTLSSAGTITEPAGGSITATTLNGSSVGNASLDQGNLLGNLGPFTTTASGTFTLTDNQALTVSGPLNSAGDLRIRANTGDLTLVGNITAGGGSGNAALVATTGNASELDDPVVRASGLIVDAGGNVRFGVSGGEVFPANANAVGTLAGTAGGSFGFLNGPALTIGTVPATGGVASQSGISASATTAGDVLIQTSNLGQPLALAGNIIAGGRAILDTAGGFSQTGTVTVTGPVLAIDTTGSGVGTLLGFITSTNVNANVIAGLPPAGKTSNPMQFANLSAPNSVVLLFADQGAVAGTIQAGQLGLSGIGSGADLRGSISGVTDPTAALLGVRYPEPAPTYLFNDCIIAAATCFVPSAAAPIDFLVVQPQSASGITAFDLLPDIAATADFITPEAVRALRQSPDPDAPVINIFDEEHLCDETAKGSQPGRERCQEQR